MKLYIKYMVSIRCKMIVKAELAKLGLHYISVELGNIDVKEDITDQQLQSLNDALKMSGLELMDDKKAILIDRIKKVVIEMIHYTEEPPTLNFSNFLSEKLSYDYTYMANIFAEVTGTTIELFVIAHKIERVKELLIYDELSLTQISYKLHYSSVAHLSHQFKKVTGLTPTFFKNLKLKKRTMLGDVTG